MEQIVFGHVTWLMLIAQIIGVFGMIMNFISYQQNTNKGIVGVQIFGAVFFCIHLLLLGAYTGAALNAVGIIRNVVFFCRPKKWATSITWVYIFCTAYVIAGIVTWNGIVSLLPTFAMIFGTIALYIVKPKLTRRFALTCSIGWICYNALSGSIPGTVSEVFTILSIVLAMFKFDFKKLSATQVSK